MRYLLAESAYLIYGWFCACARARTLFSVRPERELDISSVESAVSVVPYISKEWIIKFQSPCFSQKSRLLFSVQLSRALRDHLDVWVSRLSLLRKAIMWFGISAFSPRQTDTDSHPKTPMHTDSLFVLWVSWRDLVCVSIGCVLFLSKMIIDGEVGTFSI